MYNYIMTKSMNENQVEPEAYKSLAYSFKDTEAQQKQLTQKLLRIIRELDKRITVLENKRNE